MRTREKLCRVYPNHSEMNDLVSASFGFVLRSPKGGETKPLG